MREELCGPGAVRSCQAGPIFVLYRLFRATNLVRSISKCVLGFNSTYEPENSRGDNLILSLLSHNNLVL
jgi:hypothetical protein